MRTFGSEVILEVLPAVDIDTHRFAAAVKEAFTRSDLTDSLSPLEKACDCYLGPFLDGEEADWILEERERLHSMFVRAGSALLRLFGHVQRYEEGITIARRLLWLDPFRELIHRSLLVLLVLNGQRAEALRNHERWSALFRRDLNIEPMPQTLQVFEQIRNGGIFEILDKLKSNYFLPQSDGSGQCEDSVFLDPGSRQNAVDLSPLRRASAATSNPLYQGHSAPKTRI